MERPRALLRSLFNHGSWRTLSSLQYLAGPKGLGGGTGRHRRACRACSGSIGGKSCRESRGASGGSPSSRTAALSLPALPETGTPPWPALRLLVSRALLPNWRLAGSLAVLTLASEVEEKPLCCRAPSHGSVALGRRGVAGALSFLSKRAGPASERRKAKVSSAEGRCLGSGSKHRSMRSDTSCTISQSVSQQVSVTSSGNAITHVCQHACTHPSKSVILNNRMTFYAMVHSKIC